jgi:hypothetical protein
MPHVNNPRVKGTVLTLFTDKANTAEVLETLGGMGISEDVEVALTNRQAKISFRAQSNKEMQQISLELDSYKLQCQDAGIEDGLTQTWKSKSDYQQRVNLGDMEAAGKAQMITAHVKDSLGMHKCTILSDFKVKKPTV